MGRIGRWAMVVIGVAALAWFAIDAPAGPAPCQVGAWNVGGDVVTLVPTAARQPQRARQNASRPCSPFPGRAIVRKIRHIAPLA